MGSRPARLGDRGAPRSLEPDVRRSPQGISPLALGAIRTWWWHAPAFADRRAREDSAAFSDYDPSPPFPPAATRSSIVKTSSIRTELAAVIAAPHGRGRCDRRLARGRRLETA